MGKKPYKKVKDSSKTYPKVDAKKIAKTLGAKLIIDPKEIKEFEKRYRLPNVFIPTVKKPQKSKKK